MYLQPCVSSSSAILWFLSGDRSSNSIWGNIGSSHVKEPQSKHHGGGGMVIDFCIDILKSKVWKKNICIDFCNY